MKDQTEIKPEFCPVTRVFEMFGISESTAYRLEKAGIIRFVRIRKRSANSTALTLVDCDSVRAFFASQQAINTTPGQAPKNKRQQAQTGDAPK